MQKKTLLYCVYPSEFDLINLGQFFLCLRFLSVLLFVSIVLLCLFNGIILCLFCRFLASYSFSYWWSVLREENQKDAAVAVVVAVAVAAAVSVAVAAAVAFDSAVAASAVALTAQSTLFNSSSRKGQSWLSSSSSSVLTLFIVLFQRKFIFRDITWNVAGKTWQFRYMTDYVE